MVAAREKYTLDTSGGRFEILPVLTRDFVLSIDGQLEGFYPDAKSAAEDCYLGHVSTIISVERTYCVNTRSICFPSSLLGWKASKRMPIEIGEYPSFAVSGG